MPFEKGKSGNPGGRPKEDTEVRKLAREHGVDAVKKLVELLSCGEGRTEMAAANALLDRGFGKPAQSLTVSGDEDAPLVTRIERVIKNTTD